MKMNKGFSLIELMVILMIISAIGYFSFPLLSISIKNERETRTIEKMNKLESAILYYFDDNNVFPVSTGSILDDLLVLEKNVENNPKWRGPYIHSEFKGKDYLIDGWNNYFLYSYTPDNLFCEIISVGEDGIPHTEDDIVKTINAIIIVKKKVQETKIELAVINSAAEKFRNDNGFYPDSIFSLIPDYLGDAYIHDPWENEYYVLNGNIFYSFGANGLNEFGEGDDIK